MPKINFSNIDDMDDFGPVPDGQYLCRLMYIESGKTKNHDDMWKLRWKIEGGNCDGRLLFGNLIFNLKGIPKLKQLCICCVHTTRSL